MMQCEQCAYLTGNLKCNAPLSAAHTQMLVSLPSAFERWPPMAPIHAPEQECRTFKPVCENDG